MSVIDGGISAHQTRASCNCRGPGEDAAEDSEWLWLMRRLKINFEVRHLAEDTIGS
jgi:hypothetical protein